MSDRSTIGLIVNPIAGIGGRVGLKGSDGADLVRRAIALGGVPESNDRAVAFLVALRARWPTMLPQPEILAAAGRMGETAALKAGFVPRVIGGVAAKETTASDTRRAVAEMTDRAVRLLLFVGGDGTARDVVAEVGNRTPVLGIPAGVKIHSAAFATSPLAAAQLAVAFITSASHRCADREVLDLDEDAYRRGEIGERLFGFLSVPIDVRRVQSRKAPSPLSEAAATATVAAEVVDGMIAGRRYVLGPGTTVRAVAERLNVPKTLVGVDVVLDRQLIARDAGEREVMAAVVGHSASIVVAPIGGQGFLFGRGNQPIGPTVIRAVGRKNIIIVASPQKLATLAGQPFLIDTGDAMLDEELAGFVTVITGFRDRVVYRIALA